MQDLQQAGEDFLFMHTYQPCCLRLGVTCSSRGERTLLCGRLFWSCLMVMNWIVLMLLHPLLSVGLVFFFTVRWKQCRHFWKIKLSSTHFLLIILSFLFFLICFYFFFPLSRNPLSLSLWLSVHGNSILHFLAWTSPRFCYMPLWNLKKK